MSLKKFVVSLAVAIIITLVLSFIFSMTIYRWTVYLDAGDESKKQIRDLKKSLLFVEKHKCPDDSAGIPQCFGSNNKYPLWVYIDPSDRTKSTSYQGYIPCTFMFELPIKLYKILSSPPVNLMYLE